MTVVRISSARMLTAAVLLSLALLLTGCGGLSEPADKAEVGGADNMPAVGSSVTLGRWPLGNGTQADIEWRMLTVEDNCALVISERLLEARPYNDIHEDTTWEKCSLREWLNGEFIETAFTGEERARITESKVPNPNNKSFFWVDGGRTTRDRIFCLSTEEAEKYFSGDGDRAAVFLISEDSQPDAQRPGDWWLRSPGGLADHAAAVSGDGHIMGLGVSAGRGTNGVRPAMRLRFG